MLYNEIKEGIFLERPNRFIGRVIVDGNEEIVHVKNTGRCKEILKPGVKVYLETATNTERKTKYSLISAYKENMLINIDSQVPNAVVFDALNAELIDGISGIKTAKREVVYGNSRFDMYFEGEEGHGFIEVKGVTLENDGIASFPDAPTARGRKHVIEMVEAVKNGYIGIILFLIQMKGVNSFHPNEATDKAFAEALRYAKQNGVRIIGYDSIVTRDQIVIDKKVRINL